LIVRRFLTSTFLFAIGVQLLEEAYRKVCDEASEAAEPSFLLDAYSVALTVAQGGDASTPNGRNGHNPQDAVLSKNGKMVNGIHHSSQKKKTSTRDDDMDAVVTRHAYHKTRTIPQAFIDSATSVAVSILCSSGSFIAESAIRNDARLVLRRLVRSGKVSARTHLVHISDMAKSSNFFGLLRALELSAEEEGTWSAYTPIELANDIFSFCPDASERQMIAAIHYTLSRALPKDIASFFARDKSVGEQHPFLRRSVRYSALASKLGLSADEKDELAVLGHRLILSGTALLTQRVTEYSKVNLSLLRDAFESELSQDEVRLLAQFLIDILTSPDKFRLSLKAGATSNALQCLSALCDSLHGTLAEDEGKDFARIRNAVSAELSKTGVILSLQKALQESVELIGSGSGGRSEASGQVMSDKKPSTSLPPYQIERLLF
jgi:hypothetical protein